MRGVRRRRRAAAASCGGRTPCSARCSRGCARRPASTADTLVVLGAGDEMAATLGAGVVEPGVVCDVLGTAEPVCAVVGEPAHDPTGRRRAASARRPRHVAAGEPGLAVGRRLPLVPRRARRARGGARGRERRRRLRAARTRWPSRAPPGAGRRVVGPALAGAMAPEWNARRARGLVRDDGGARPRAPGARAAGGQRARAARRDRGDRRRRPRAERGRLRRRRGARAAAARAARARHRAAGLPARGRRDDRPRRRDARGGGRGAAPVGRRRRAGDGLPRAASRSTPDPELRGVYDELHARHRRLYDALRPLFNGEVGAMAGGALERRASRRRRARGGDASGSSTCSSSAAGSRGRARRSTPPRAGCGSGWSRRATSPRAPRAPRASSSTAGCATSRWATSGWCARRCASASCC